MTFTVTYRDSTGKMIRTDFESESRSTLLKTLSEKGISPIQISRSSNNKGNGNKNLILTRWVATTVIVISCVAGLFYLISRPDKNPAESKKRTPVTKTPVKKPVAKSRPKQKPVSERLTQEKPQSKPPDPCVVDGKVVHPPWGASKNIVTGGTHRVKSLSEKCFHTVSDVEIAGLLTIEPVEELVGSSEEIDYHNFDKKFLKSLETPIVIQEDDTPDMVALKESVKEMRLMLKEKLDAGEDISQIMIQTRKELRALGAYRQELQQELNKIMSKPETGEMDFKDYVEAANIVLKERGAKEIVMPEIVYERLKYRHELLKSQSKKKGTVE
jgi:hypothetical protein